MEERKFKFKDLWPMAKKAFNDWNDDDAFTLAASVSYYAIFALPALLLIVITIIGTIYGQQAVQGQISQQISSVVGENAAKQLEQIIANTSVAQSGTIMTIIGIATLLVSATGLFIQLQKALNQVWEVKPNPDAGVSKMLLDRTESFGLILVIGFLLLVSLIVTTAISALTNYISSQLPEFTIYLFYALNFIVSFAIITVLFAMIFKILPDVKIRFRSVWVGAAVTAFLFMLGKFALGIYFGNFNPGSAYGAAGSIILILLWVYYSSLLLFYGAEFTQVYAKRYGHTIEPASNAIRVTPCPQT